jgi:cytochrome o ubiquinol oxidase subunit 2
LAALACAAPLLSGCQMDVLDPAGPIGSQEKSLIIIATALMLIVVIPVIIMTIAFAWRYRASNEKATYKPDWEHSNQIELVIWLVPCVIIIALGAVTWVSTHRLDPYNHIQSKTKPIQVDVVSLDWKLLFIYPDQKVASVNALVLPVGVPVNFHLTSTTVMNSFFIPRLGSQIYTMPGMDTKLSLMASQPGVYQGISANFSGDGFSDMSFKTTAVSAADFNRWVQSAQASNNSLDMAAYTKLAAPSEKVPVTLYSQVEPALYHEILNQRTGGAGMSGPAMTMNPEMKMSPGTKTSAGMKMSMLDAAGSGGSAAPTTSKKKGL